MRSPPSYRRRRQRQPAAQCHLTKPLRHDFVKREFANDKVETFPQKRECRFDNVF